VLRSLCVLRSLHNVHAGNPWEMKRPILHPIKFGGSCIKQNWKPAFTVYAQAYDNPIPGWKTRNCGNLRLWDALPANELDLDAFNRGALMASRCELYYL
jgi:glycogen phosphorylase